MYRTLLLCALVSGLAVGCANGWPRVHTPPPKTAATICTPTTSRIARHDCAISTPANRTPGGDMDRGQDAKRDSMGVMGPTPRR